MKTTVILRQTAPNNVYKLVFDESLYSMDSRVVLGCLIWRHKDGIETFMIPMSSIVYIKEETNG